MFFLVSGIGNLVTGIRNPVSTRVLILQRPFKIIPYDNARLNLMALSTSSMLSLLSRPRRFSNRSFEMVRIWFVFMIEGWSSPPSGGLICTFIGYTLTELEMAATIVVGAFSLPISFWMTSAGRLPACSLPLAGFQFTSHTSPRLGKPFILVLIMYPL